MNTEKKFGPAAAQPGLPFSGSPQTPRPTGSVSGFDDTLRRATAIEGFMSEKNITIWDALLAAQRDFGFAGHFLEIGVFKGRSAAVLQSHLQVGDRFWLVDYSQSLAEARTNLSAHPGAAQLVFLNLRSTALWNDPEIFTRQRLFRWVHIDGEHTASAVLNDLNLAARLLSENGLICVDDFFNSAYPQVTAALYRWLAANPGELELILGGENKAYLTRPTVAHRYAGWIRHSLGRELRARACTDFTIYKTAPDGDSNTWGIQKRNRDFDYYGLDSDPSVIV